MGSLDYERDYQVDKLKERAEIFNKLINVEYNIVLGKRGRLTSLKLSFDKKDFHHLIGLQYLKDRPELRQDGTKLFDMILHDKMTCNQISNSAFFSSIENRFLSFVYIEQFLDSNSLVFKFNRKARPGLKMEAKYILESIANNHTAYICIDKHDGLNNYFCRSFFPKEQTNYTLGHIRYALLYKEKVNVVTKEKIIQYNKLRNESTLQ